MERGGREGGLKHVSGTRRRRRRRHNGFSAAGVEVAPLATILRNEPENVELRDARLHCTNELLLLLLLLQP